VEVKTTNIKEKIKRFTPLTDKLVN